LLKHGPLDLTDHSTLFSLAPFNNYLPRVFVALPRSRTRSTDSVCRSIREVSQSISPELPAADEQNDSFVSRLFQFVIFAGAFYLAYRFSTARLWLPDSVLLVTLLFTPRNRWWMFLLVPLGIRYFVGRGAELPVDVFLANYANDILKAIIGASLLRWLNNGPTKLATIRELFQFFVVAVVFTPALSAFAGAATRVSIGENYWTSWQIWFLGDALANLILTPMLIYWYVEDRSSILRASKARWLEVCIVFGALILVGALGPVSNATSGIGNSPILVNLTLPLLLYAAVRFGPRGVSTAIVILTAFVVFEAKYSGQGPFAVRGPGVEILWIQMVFYVVTIPLLCVAVVLRQSNENALLALENQKEAHDLAGKLINLQDDERRRIAHSLHDTLGQSLTVIKIVADTGAQKTEDQPEVAKQFAEISDVAATAHQDVRDIVQNLRPAGLDHFGLAHAVKAVIRRFSRSTSIELSAKLDPIDGVLTKDEETSVFRIVQEALSNVVRHSNATKAEVIFHRNSQGLDIIVEDNGTGINVDSLSTGEGFGLSGIAQRVRLLDGTFDIDSAPGKGTRLIINLQSRTTAHT
jgi:signal transduction histidine kinase